MRGAVAAAIAAAAVAVAAPWGSAIEVPGTASLNSGGYARVFTVSCPAAANCVASGFYRNKAGHDQAFAVNEKNGVWGSAFKVRGLGRGDSYAYALSCASRRSCAAGGMYDTRSDTHAFVVNEVYGVWRKATDVPGLAALNTAPGIPQVSDISCARAGFCSAGGMYWTNDGPQAFVVNERRGVWRKAIALPGSAALSDGFGGWVNAISCATPRSCAAGGTGFIVTERHGVWGRAMKVKGPTVPAGSAEVDGVSCPQPDRCVAVGTYVGASGHSRAFVVEEVNGVWQKAIDVPGISSLDAGGDGWAGSVSCAAAGSCAVGGVYDDGSGHQQPFVADEVNGIWQDASEVPGTDALNAGGKAEVDAISCAAPGFCAAGGSYLDSSGVKQAFVASEQAGVWGDAVEVPGTSALNLSTDPQYPGAEVDSISCPTASSCVLGGLYTDAGNKYQAYVTTP